MHETDEETLWYHPSLDVFLNQWFSDYEEARNARERERGFLLPYKNHFFVCKAEVIHTLGMDADDPDWEAIGWDCARPGDRQAYHRLREKREQVALDG